MRVFVDFDGCLAEFRHGVPVEKIYEKGYFRSLKANRNIVDAVKMLCNMGIDVYLLSAVLDNDYARLEKEEWMNAVLPEIKPEKRLYPTYGSDKTKMIPGGVTHTDVLIDDYSPNCNQWLKNHGSVIKVARDRTDQIKESAKWDKCISPDSSPEEILKLL